MYIKIPITVEGYFYSSSSIIKFSVTLPSLLQHLEYTSYHNCDWLLKVRDSINWNAYVSLAQSIRSLN